MTTIAGVSEDTLLQKIREILVVADLSQMTSKRVRKQLEVAFSVDLKAHKSEIDKLVIDVLNEQSNFSSSPPTAAAATAESNNNNNASNAAAAANAANGPTNGAAAKEDKEEEEMSPDDASPSPARTQTRNRKSSPTKSGRTRTAVHIMSATVASDDDLSDDDITLGRRKEKMSDEELARQIQMEDMGLRRREGRTRSARSTTKSPMKPRKPREISEKQRMTGFHAPVVLSEPLSQFVGSSEMSRAQVVKKIWEHVKENKLQDPEDKRYIVCDEKLYPVFKKDKVHMFSMNKLLNGHIKKKEDVVL